MELIGRRLPDAMNGGSGATFKPGEYQKQVNGTWLARPPEGHLGDLRNHSVIEHEDGTITVSPSILVTGWNGDQKEIWHGHLQRGIWKW